jgi:hypothetical protein
VRLQGSPVADCSPRFKKCSSHPRQYYVLRGSPVVGNRLYEQELLIRRKFAALQNQQAPSTEISQSTQDSAVNFPNPIPTESRTSDEDNFDLGLDAWDDIIADAPLANTNGTVAVADLTPRWHPSPVLHPSPVVHKRRSLKLKRSRPASPSSTVGSPCQFDAPDSSLSEVKAQPISVCDQEESYTWCWCWHQGDARGTPVAYRDHQTQHKLETTFATFTSMGKQEMTVDITAEHLVHFTPTAIRQRRRDNWSRSRLVTRFPSGR